MNLPRLCFRNDAATNRLEDWNMAVSGELVQLTGRVLPPEKIEHGVCQGERQSVSELSANLGLTDRIGH